MHLQYIHIGMHVCMDTILYHRSIYRLPSNISNNILTTLYILVNFSVGMQWNSNGFCIWQFLVCCSVSTSALWIGPSPVQTRFLQAGEEYPKVWKWTNLDEMFFRRRMNIANGTTLLNQSFKEFLQIKKKLAQKCLWPTKKNEQVFNRKAGKYSSVF